jgi:hypothetical protein
MYKIKHADISEPGVVLSRVIEKKIYIIRGQKVMIDFDLAELYMVPTYRLNEAVKRNRKRFPEDFMFQLTKEEGILTSQFAMSKKGDRGGRRTLPYAFTEQGVAMLSSILNSERAIEVNIAIKRTFVQIRKLMTSNEELGRKLKEIEATYDERFKVVFTVLRKLINPPDQHKSKIGFKTQ